MKGAIMRRTVIAGILLALLVLAGCAGKAAEPASDKTLDTAVRLMDSADAVVDLANAGDDGSGAALDTFDARLEGFGKGAGPDEMPEFYAAISDWREALEAAISTDSGVMVDRSQEDMDSAYAKARGHLDAALDAAGR